jgi:hypothetical protein
MNETATCASDRSAEHAARLITSLDQSAFTSRHAWIFGALMFGHFFDGFDLVLMGVALPGIIATFRAEAGADPRHSRVQLLQRRRRLHPARERSGVACGGMGAAG